MSRRREPLLMKSTRVPGGTVSSFGRTPVGVIGMRYWLVEGGGVGPAGFDDPPPQAATRRKRGVSARPVMPRILPLLNDDGPLHPVVFRIIVVVVAARPPHVQRTR